MSALIKEERHQLLERYQQCTPTEQAAVNLLAVAWGGLSKSQITTPLRKILSADEAAKIKLELLQRSGLIEGNRSLWSSHGLRCNRLIAEPVTRKLVANGTFEHYVELVRLAAPASSLSENRQRRFPVSQR